MDKIRSVFPCKRNMVPSTYKTIDMIYKTCLEKGFFLAGGSKANDVLVHT